MLKLIASSRRFKPAINDSQAGNGIDQWRRPSEKRKAAIASTSRNVSRAQNV